MNLVYHSIALMAMAFALASPAQQVPASNFGQPTGSYKVGFRAVQQIDAARAYAGKYDDLGKPLPSERGRPIQTLIWYPAESGGRAMTFDDYLILSAGEEGPPRGDINKSVGYARFLFKAVLHDPMRARQDAPVLREKFPVVIYAPSFRASAFENADLCEYLASYGYVVIASPDFGAHQRMMTSDQAGINAQAGDISFLIGYASALPDADTGRIAVAGYSWGGISNLYAAARDSRIDALVFLDGSARYFPKLVKDSGDVDPALMSLPMLFFTGGEVSLEELEHRPSLNAPNVLNELGFGDLTIVRMHWMHHGDFSSNFFRMVASLPEGTSRPPGYEDATIAEQEQSYGWVERYTRAFLDSVLKGEATETAFLKRSPIENGVPRHLLSVEQHPAKGPAPTFDNFRGQIGTQGFDHLNPVYASFQKASPEFKLSEEEVNSWGYRLLNHGHEGESIAVMKFNTEQYPKSTNAWDALGEAYRASGDKHDAITAWKQAITVDPENKAVLQKLAESER